MRKNLLANYFKTLCICYKLNVIKRHCSKQAEGHAKSNIKDAMVKEWGEGK